MHKCRTFSFRSVILGTDFSDEVSAASRYAALLAEHYDALLIVAHAFSLTSHALEAEILDHVLSMQRRELQQLLCKTAARLTPPALRSRTVLFEGEPVELIGRLSQEQPPSLTVLGAHGAGALRRHIIGSVAEAILRTVESPVLTVGPNVNVPSMETLVFRRILYATDFSSASTRVAPYAFALAKAFCTDLDVLHVIPDEAYSGAVSRSNMEQLIPEEIKSCLQSQTFVEYGKAHQRIVSHALENNVDLIVLGAHHHSQLSMHLRSGPAFRTILDASCPVLTICA